MTTAPTDAPRHRILYFADPMCSWCWGFAPVLHAIRAAAADVAPIRLCVGGLRAYETQPMTERARNAVRHHWQEVTGTTGQPFDFAFFERASFVYDTEPACRAAVAMRNLAPSATFTYFAALQHAFYAQNRDVTREDVLAEVAAAFADPEHFRFVFNAPEVHEATRADFALSQRLGIPGFPTVLLQTGQELTALTTGWQPFAALEPELREWLAA